MRNSDRIRDRAAEAIDRLTCLLNEEYLRETIDTPIDTVARQCLAEAVPVATAAAFQDRTAALVQALYARALSPPRSLTMSQARDEAARLLGGYGGTYADGYDAALMDAVDPAQPGIGLVLARLAELVKERRREDHLRWAVARCLDPADHRLKAAVAAELIDRYGSLLPPEVRAGPPGRWGPDAVRLLTAILAAGAPAASGRPEMLSF